MKIRDMACYDCKRPFLWKKDAMTVVISSGQTRILCVVCVSCSEKHRLLYPTFNQIPQEG